ncbi:hypothetical protein LCGC14_0945130 [marine sediment metagenome]|uniref:Glycosyl transferase family 1 domain-containing protein n=1 Tax=marine sediment metagenome TaxID=412755 RepID=A0A0F9NNN4_9ZZZZ
MKKRILYIGYNFSPELTGIGKYSGEMMEWLAKSGHECSVITAYPYYPEWKVAADYRKKRFWYHTEIQDYPGGGQLKVYRCPMFVPEHPTGIKRILTDLTFFCTAFIRMLSLLFKKKYNYVISVAPTFKAGILGALYHKMTGAKHIHHIQDLQIEAARDLGMIKSKSVINLLFKIEKFIFKNAEVISSISEAMIKRISEKANREIAFLPNWTDTDFFYPIPDKKGLKEKFGFKPEHRIILYSGAIGEKQGLENILNTAKTLEVEPNLRFIICGSGPYKEVLKKRSEKMGLHNVSFLPLQSKEDFNAFLNMADIHLIIQKKDAGDLVMPSKLTTILAVGGLVLVTAEPDTDLFELILKYDIGLTVQPEDEKALTDGILKLIQTDHAAIFQKNALNYAHEHLMLDRIMKHLDKNLLSVF